ncbi:MAG: hypothetical protein Q8P00_05280, partial [Dehalococcoidia bacterium]|nr:hypothetical protein [Dehalococcoidia bacterium]
MGMLLVTLSLITAFAALVGVFINRRQLSQQRIELSKEYVKELIALALYPQMRRCAEVLDKLA